MTNVSYSAVVSRLLYVIPEIRSEYEEEEARWGGDQPPAHIVYGSVFPKFINRIISEEPENGKKELSDIVNRAFDLIEELTNSDDFETRCVVEASVLESLLGAPGGWDRFSHLFRPSTMKKARDVMSRFEGKEM